MQESTENHSKPQGYYSTGSLFNDVTFKTHPETFKKLPKHSKTSKNISNRFKTIHNIPENTKIIPKNDSFQEKLKKSFKQIQHIPNSSRKWYEGFGMFWMIQW